MFATDNYHPAAFECARSTLWAKLDIRRIVASLYRFLKTKNKTISVHELQSLPTHLVEPEALSISTPFNDLSRESKFIHPSDRNPGQFSTFRQNDVYWPSKEVVLRYFYEGRIEVRGDGDTLDQRLFGAFATRHGRSLQSANIESDFVLVPLALLMCLKFLQDSAFFQYLSAYGKSNVRGALKLQLVEVERWFNDPSMRDISKDAGSEKLRDDVESLEIDLPKFEPKLSSSMTEAMAETTDPYEGLDTLITYRAILTAAFLSTAADVSCVAGTALGRRIVQMI